MRQGVVRTYGVFLWIFLGAVVVQFFLAGLGIFVNPDDFGIHAIFGIVILLIGLITLGLAFAARRPGRVTGLTALLPLLVVIQVVLVEVSHAGLAIVGAFHVVNALVIFSLTGYLAFTQSAVGATARRAAVEEPAPLG